MPELTQTQARQRNAMLGLPLDTDADLTHLSALTIEDLDRLVFAGFLDPLDQQNAAPTVGEMMTFLRKHPLATAHGYMISWKRPDARISLEGLACTGPNITPELRADFFELCRDADEFQFADDLYAWWD